eukprot:TRINITY_DN48643_c0_g1_i1.p1 TRINITY_DN48643_c0_g1~~TRINITY_DN48643_c0_g1_i1.p1  ORF type:complete len:353 (-),score=70.23 TRINITY_DN48643_c0_g1_i1:172-1230(-)
MAMETTSQAKLFHRTIFCTFYANNKCRRGDACKFAHDKVELRTKPNFFKTRLCTSFLSGYCPDGDSCGYAHGVEDIRENVAGDGSAPTKVDPAQTFPRPAGPRRGQGKPGLIGNMTQHDSMRLKRRDYAAEVPDSKLFDDVALAQAAGWMSELQKYPSAMPDERFSLKSSGLDVQSLQAQAHARHRLAMLELQQARAQMQEIELAKAALQQPQPESNFSDLASLNGELAELMYLLRQRAQLLGEKPAGTGQNTPDVCGSGYGFMQNDNNYAGTLSDGLSVPFGGAMKFRSSGPASDSTRSTSSSSGGNIASGAYRNMSLDVPNLENELAFLQGFEQQPVRGRQQNRGGHIAL